MSKSPGMLGLVVVVVLTAAAPLAAAAGSPLQTLSQETVDGITQVHVQFPGHHRAVTGTLFLPPGEGKRSAVVFTHSGAGVTDAIVWRSRNLAANGYVVFAPEYRADTNAPLFEIMPGDVENVLAADEALRTHPRVNPHAVGIIGSGHGSLVAMLAEATAGPRHFRCLGQASGNQGAKDRAPDIKAPVFIQHGARDAVAEMQEARFMGIELKNTGNSNVEIKEYTLGKYDLWFHRDKTAFTTEEINQANWAWDDLNAFLNRHLGSTGGVSARE